MSHRIVQSDLPAIEKSQIVTLRANRRIPLLVRPMVTDESDIEFDGTLDWHAARHLVITQADWSAPGDVLAVVQITDFDREFIPGVVG